MGGRYSGSPTLTWDSATRAHSKLQSEIDQLGVKQVKAGNYIGPTDAEGFLMIANPFASASISVFAMVSPNGMADSSGRVFSVFVWDVTPARMRLRIRREDTNKWIDKQAVRVQWVAFR
nr:MAG TPA: hypothetical protein [Caudoviricetes sp.]